MSRKVVFGVPPFEGDGVSFGSVANFPLSEILLYCIHVNTGDWTCSYDAGGNAYGSDKYASIGAFIYDLQRDSLAAPSGPLPVGANDTAPDIIVRNPCYVVVKLSSDDATLCYQAEAMRTATDCSVYYRGLTRAFNDSDGRNRVVYFAVPNPRYNVDDPYNLYVQYGSGVPEGDPILKTIDPKIKNRGPEHL